MSDNTEDKPEDWPELGQRMSWVDKPGNAGLIVTGLTIFCIILFLLDFTYAKHGHFHIEDLPGFYGVYGFIMFSFIIIAAKTLRILIKRPEDYYGDKAVDREDYPEDQLEKVNHHAD